MSKTLPGFDHAGATGVRLLIGLFFVVAPVVPGTVSQLPSLLGLAALVWGWQGLRRTDRDERVLLIGFAAYVALALPSLLNNADFDTAGWRFERYHPFLLAIPVFGLILRAGALGGHVLLASLALAALCAGGLALYEHQVLGLTRVGEGTGFNPNIFGHLVSVIASVLLVGALASDGGKQRRLWCFAAFLVASFAVLMSGSRGAVLALAATLFVAGGLYLYRVRPGRGQVLRLAGGAALIVALAGGTMATSKLWPGHWANLYQGIAGVLEENYEDVSISARSAMLMAAWRIWTEHPWIGTGLGDAQADFDRLVGAGEIPDVGGSSHVFHNTYADALSTSGLVGLAGALGGVMAIPAWLFWRRLGASAHDSPGFFFALAGLALVVNLAVFGFTNSWLYLRGLPYILLLLLVLAAGAGESARASASR